MEDYYYNNDCYYSPMHDERTDSCSTEMSDCFSEGFARSEEDVVVLASSKPKKRAGRKVFTETRHPVYRGVRRRDKGRWVCELREPNKGTRVWLGTYATAEMAARAHDLAALALWGKGGGACLNFADSAWRLPTLPASTDPVELRRIAATVAEEFGGMEIDKGEVRSSEREARSGNADWSGSRTVEIAAEMETEAAFDVRECAEWPLLSPASCVDVVHVNWDCYGNNSEGDAGFMDMSLWNF